VGTEQLLREVGVFLRPFGGDSFLVKSLVLLDFGQYELVRSVLTLRRLTASLPCDLSYLLEHRVLPPTSPSEQALPSTKKSSELRIAVLLVHCVSV
jgi:hypothetical protein